MKTVGTDNVTGIVLKTTRPAGLVLFSIFFFLFSALAPASAVAQEFDFEQNDAGLTQTENFYVAAVLGVEQMGENQNVTVKILKGERAGQEVLVADHRPQPGTPGEVEPGDKIVLGEFSSLGETIYYIADQHRTNALLWALAGFVVLAIAFGRWKGFTSLLGLGFTILVIVNFIVPQIAQGANPVLVTLVGAFVIAIVAIYLAHGFNLRTSLAVVSTLITLAVSAVITFLTVNATNLFGLGSEEALLLNVSGSGDINLKGLLLGGIIIGTLGVLDDVTTSQTAAVDEIRKANASLGFGELYRRGLSVGHEHIAALINTLALAYAGVSLPLFLLFSFNNTQPLWVTLNGELIAEEVVRTLIGSASLILAVPIATLLAAYWLPRLKTPPGGGEAEHTHKH